MALSPNTTTCLLLLATLLSFFVSLTTSASDPEELVNELLSLQSQSKTGVIHLDDNSISRFLTSTKTPRPYSLLIFFDATHLHDKHELRLQYLHDEFSLVASSFILNNPDKSSASYAKLFFCDVEFKESESSFSLFGVDAVPNIRLVGPNVKNPKDSDEVEQGDVPGTAELMSDFVESSIKVSVGPIHRPPFLSTKQLGLLFVVFSIWTPFMVKKTQTTPAIWFSFTRGPRCSWEQRGSPLGSCTPLWGYC
uniref:Thioredoxin domain-containing protein n=1 Tax=Manihot esculenta TaxID=3983 RepID=A0A2C9U4Q3_MANES